MTGPPVAARPAQSPIRRRRLSRRARRILLLTPLALLGLLIILAGVVYAATKVPNPSDVSTAQTTVVAYADGTTEIGRLGSQNRTDVPLSRVPQQVRQAVLAAEDRNYYSEPGISVPGIARAVLANLRGGSVQQGGSTITQQYAKNAYLTQARTFRRKIREIFIAVKLDRTRSKDTVLEDYLNTIYFGRGAYGIEAAAQTYFAKSVDVLTVEQGAVLAASIRSPSGYDPALHPQAARERWRYVLDGMTKQGWLEPARAAAAVYPTLAPRQAAANQLTGPKGYLVRQVEDELTARGIAEDTVHRSGLRVTTTIDVAAQQAAVTAGDSVLGGNAPADLRQALVAIEPGTGRIRAEYAGKDYVTNPFNTVVQADVQPGSSFKPYVLLAALRAGIGVRSRYDGSSPQTFRGQQVTNFADEQFGDIDLVTATAHSVNTVYVPLALDAGLDNVVRAAADAGITSPMDIGGATGAGTSLALGGFGRGVHPLDQAAAYAAFAARGVAAAPYLVEKVTNAEGRTLYQAAPTATPKFDRAVVDDATFAMQSVVDDGTATNAQLSGGRPAAGKTGTTSGNTAAWFCGYTPQLAAVSVLFRDGNAPLQGIAGVSEVTGGTLPASIWKTFMDQALQGQPVRRFASPAYVGSTRYAGPSPTVTSSATASATPSPASTRSPTARPAPSRSAGASPLATPSATRSVPPSSLPPSSSGSAAPSAGASTPPSAAAAAAQSPAFAPKSTNPLADGSG